MRIPPQAENTKNTLSDDDALYGNAPWMGTLRHVKNENKVTAAIYQNPKFKKYPDEDAPNPFQVIKSKLLF